MTFSRYPGCILFAVAAIAVCGWVNASLAAQDVPDTQFGDFLFKVPNGWTPTPKGDAMLIVAPQLHLGTVTYIAMAANDLDGDLQKSYNELWTGFQNSYRILQGGQINPVHSNHGYDAYYTIALASDATGHQWKVCLMGAQYGKRLETVMFLSDLPEGVSYDAVLQTFQHFLGNLSFGSDLPGSKIPANSGAAGAANPGTTETPPTLPPGTLQGVYVCMASADGRPSNKQFIFYPDGFMMNGIPAEGMLGFDFNHYRGEDNPTKNWFGRYRVDGDKVKIVWQNEFTDPTNPAVIKLSEKSAHPAWEVGWDTFIPMCRCTGKRFSGKYLWGLPVADQYLQFFADGTFIDHRVTDQLLVNNAFYEHPRIQRGTYSIQSQTMIFNFADGHHGTRTFVAPKAQENDATFDWIGLGWQQLFEEGYAARLAR